MLRDIQREFLKSYYDETKRDRFVSRIYQSHHLSKERRYFIYHDSITACLARALQETYPVCKKLVGQDFFLAMAYAYIEKNPSRSPNLNNYGDAFPEFVAQFQAAATLPYLSDVCRLEWAWHQAYHAPDATPLNIERLAQLSEDDQPRVKFYLPKRATLLSSRYPLLAIWHLAQSEEENSNSISLDQGGIKLLVWRQAHNVRMDELNEVQWRILQFIQQDLNLSQLCEQFSSDSGNFLQHLPNLIQQGWVNRFELS